jgi:hypothetical protein
MGRKKILFTFAVGCLIFLGGYLLIEFSEKAGCFHRRWSAWL